MESELDGEEELLPYLQHRPPLSVHPTQSVFERNYARISGWTETRIESPMGVHMIA